MPVFWSLKTTDHSIRLALGTAAASRPSSDMMVSSVYNVALLNAVRNFGDTYVDSIHRTDKQIHRRWSRRDATNYKPI